MLAVFVALMGAFISGVAPVLGGSIDGLNAMSSNNYSSGAQ
ncbi:hypothetical protein ACIQYW_02860 [Rhodococcus erythropolis]|jgi:hypothetical protein|uniref:Uncharacterized protein n=1 Tax=Rhodococcus baikonurensis TaxID=172041 RepID=A0ABV5XH99_9NOCA|nr:MULTISPECIES: hypothetical protein [Rhodococcus]MCQ4123196.1 hypothetical protein [Rhodococcus erythropolis]MDJ0011501.1 hypothetical protein [Rhodococcus erythropolis]MDJ0107929.1 hypothetical protein [Rhodococcus erythropolis]MDV8010610.1 hypothetical protein [Rhodococcus sp. IEGM 1241]